MAVAWSDPREAGGAAVAAPAVALAGLGVACAGMWARRDVRRSLVRERIEPIGSRDGGAVVSTPAGARALAELIRGSVLESTRGSTYVEVDAYLDADGRPTADGVTAARDPNTGRQLENPDHALCLEATTLQTALMQAYVAFRLAELTIALGASIALAGVAIGSLARRRRAW
jgi:hypothetical protein